MADFTALKTAIQTYIKQNGNEEITGDILQEILLSVVTTLGDGAINDLITALGNEVNARQQADGTLQQNITNEATARGNADTALSNRLGSTITAENTAAAQIAAEAEARANADNTLQGLINGIKQNIDNGYVYAGIATPSTTPVTGKVFYLALTAGTYTNFGSTAVAQGINILKYYGSAWVLDAFIGIDETPTPDSQKLVKSGGVFDSVMTNGSAFDISAHFAAGGTLATYADLSAALTALNGLDAAYKRGGMSIRFVQSSDNNYVQWRLIAQEFTTDVTQWQGVDKVPTAGSKNIVESKGVNDSIVGLGITKENTISFSAGDSFLWKTILADELVQGATYRMALTMNSPSNVVFGLCSETTNNIQQIVETKKGSIYYFTPSQSGLYLRARCAKNIAAATGDITVSLVAERLIEKNRLDIRSLEKVTVGNPSLETIDIVKSALVLNGTNNCGKWATAYWGDGNIWSFVYDVSQLVGKTIRCYGVGQKNYSRYVFVKDYSEITTEYDAAAWALNCLEQYKEPAVNLGYIYSITVPTGANQLILTGASVEYPHAYVVVDNESQEQLNAELQGIHADIQAANNKINANTNDISLNRGNIADIDGTKLVSVLTKDGKSIGSNSGVVATFGCWAYIEFKSYEGERDVPIAGTKYVGKVYDTRNLVGKQVTIHSVPRANAYKYAFVTDYTLIPETADADVWNSILVEGVTSSKTDAWDSNVIVPNNGNYLVVIGTDEDAANAVLYGKIQTIEERLNSAGIGSNNIVYSNDVKATEEKIANAKRKPHVGETAQNVTPIMLLHFSDIHHQIPNLQRIKDFVDFYHSAINDVICTGDIVYSYLGEDDLSFWSDCGAEKYLIAIGNHDAYSNASKASATPAAVYNAFIAPFIANWGSVVQPTGAGQDNYYPCYYYKDYSAAKVRLIVLDDYPKGDDTYIATENTWFQSVLEDAQTNGLSVLCAIHPMTGAVSGFDCPFNAIQKGYSSTTFNTVFKQSVKSFIDNGGDFVAWIGGHGHIDVCGVDSGSNFANQVKIAIDTASYSQGNSYSDTQRATDVSNKSYDCFNLLAVDTYQKLIKIIRIGADVDSWMRKKDMLTIQYASSIANPINAPQVISI